MGITGRRRELGAAVVEYGLLIVIIAGVIAGAVYGLGGAMASWPSPACPQHDGFCAGGPTGPPAPVPSPLLPLCVSPEPTPTATPGETPTASPCPTP